MERNKEVRVRAVFDLHSFITPYILFLPNRESNVDINNGKGMSTSKSRTESRTDEFQFEMYVYIWILKKIIKSHGFWPAVLWQRHMNTETKDQRAVRMTGGWQSAAIIGSRMQQYSLPSAHVTADGTHFPQANLTYSTASQPHSIKLNPLHIQFVCYLCVNPFRAQSERIYTENLSICILIILIYTLNLVM